MTTAPTTAGLAHFKRSITTRFAGTCVYCGKPTTPGIDLAALNGNGKWIAVCSTCATSTTEQAKALFVCIANAITGWPAEQVATIESHLPTNLTAVFAGEADALPAIAALQAAQGVVAAFKTIAAPAAAPAAAAACEPIAGNIYDVNGTLHIIRESKRGDLYALVGSQPIAGRKLSWDYVKGAISAVRRSGRLITAAEAAALGHLTHHCCFCSLELTDERSTEVGYGPICAERRGLPWG